MGSKKISLLTTSIVVLSIDVSSRLVSGLVALDDGLHPAGSYCGLCGSPWRGLTRPLKALWPSDQGMVKPWICMP